MNTSAIEIKGLEKHYKKFSLGPLDLQVDKGAVVALLGGNGSGKSTLFRIVMNILQKDKGSISLLGKNMKENEVELKQKIGFVGDLLEPFGHLTIKELANHISYWYPTWDAEYYQYLLSRYKMDEKEKYGKCSKGMKKKAEFIFSISHHPEILLLDEPTSGIDIVSQRKMKEDLTLFMENGEKSILLSTHIMEEVKQLGDYIYLLDEGKIVYSFEKDDIYDNWAKIWVTELPEKIKVHPNIVHVANSPLQITTNDFQQVQQELESHNVTISHIQRLTLEEVIEYLVEKNN